MDAARVVSRSQGVRRLTDGARMNRNRWDARRQGGAVRCGEHWYGDGQMDIV